MGRNRAAPCVFSHTVFPGNDVGNQLCTVVFGSWKRHVREKKTPRQAESNRKVCQDSDVSGASRIKRKWQHQTSCREKRNFKEKEFQEITGATAIVAIGFPFRNFRHPACPGSTCILKKSGNLGKTCFCICGTLRNLIDDTLQKGDLSTSIIEPLQTFRHFKMSSPSIIQAVQN